jgi:hypothetical protein
MSYNDILNDFRQLLFDMRVRNMLENQQEFVINSLKINEISIYDQISLSIKKKSAIYKKRNFRIIIKKRS